MRRTNSRRAYLNQVRRKLRCSGRDRKRLLSGLEAELEDRFEEEPSRLSVVTEQLGTPEEMAAELERALPYDVSERYLKRQRRLTLLGLIVGAAATACLIWYIIWIAHHDIDYIVKEIIITKGG